MCACLAGLTGRAGAGGSSHRRSPQRVPWEEASGAGWQDQRES